MNGNDQYWQYQQPPQPPVGGVRGHTNSTLVLK
jgi:hypothetical protein